MSIRLTLLSLLLSGAAAANPLSEADLATAAALRDQALEGSPAYTVVESLTREVGHRMAGSENDAKGRAWAVAKFRELGFQRVYVQPVKFPVWERGFESAGILSPTPRPLTIAALGGSLIGSSRMAATACVRVCSSSESSGTAASPSTVT